MKKAIINARIFDYRQFIENGFIVFGTKIIEVGPMSQFVDHGYEIFDGQGQLVMPNLVCGHSHIYSTFARGLILPFHPSNFQEILEQMWWKLDRQIDNETTYYSGIVASVEFMKNGVTTIIDHHASGRQITGSLEALKKAVCDKAGLRGVFAFEVSDRFDVKAAIEENRSFIANNHTSFASGLFGLHASMSLSDKTLDEVKNALGTAPIHIHVAESAMDEADCQSKYHTTILERLEKHGLLNPDSLLVHAVSVQDQELDTIKKYHATIAVNIASNMNNAVGLPDLAAFRNHGINVILGNDGLSSGMAGDYLTTFYSSHLSDKTPNGFTLGDLLSMIEDTYDYAGNRLGIKLGKFEPGYEADLLMIPYVPPTPMNQDNAFGHVFYGLFHAFKPRNVFVAGRPVVSDYEASQSLMVEYAKAKDVAIRLWENIRKEDK